MANHDDVNTPVIAAIGLLSVVLLVAFVLLLQVMYYRTSDQLDYENNTLQPPVELSSLLAEQQGKLASYAWVNSARGIAAVPIDRAMDLVLSSADPAAGPILSGEKKDEKKGESHAKP
jgi:hypothetical protein